MKRSDEGLQFFVARLTCIGDDGPEYHGYPTRIVPAKVLSSFRDGGEITAAEYRRLVKELG